ncbi:MAG: type I-E CRISPR-associated protein Cas7/Cse4/CasC [Myxococcales bacterium]|nr:type I-E CRISPR-associated protein Cas7/Cse4/CasC [Polyangiaceae bacterium]MDW8251106.1 type I-E CRISPR-associated protein Cas7/Cse4/CasC [Myxococcales bacterium]
MTSMQTPRFLQIHTLTSYPASLLNRDDAGFAKRIPFGGVSRVRISSQCLKRHWRTFRGEHSLAELNQPGSVRSRYTFEKYLIQPLLADGKSEPVVRAVVEAILPALLGKSEKAKKEEAEGEKKGKKKDGGTEPQALQTGQVTVLGRPELDYLKKMASWLCDRVPSPDKAKGFVEEHLKKSKDLRENLQAIPLAAGLDAALFGRMVTSDLLARGDAALHVAHAFTVHEEQSETDYFSAVDDLESAEGKLGSGHINTAELTTGFFYGYVVVDVPLLVSNLTGCPRKDWLSADRKLAGDVIERLVYLVATVSPGAKLGSTAPHANAHLVLVEAGNAQPSTLANAFLSPVKERPDLVANTYNALAEFLVELDAMYGARHQRRLAALKPTDALLAAAGERAPLAEVASWAGKLLRGDHD